MKSTTQALATGIIAVAMLALGAPSHAADEPRFPVIPGAPVWYMAASDAPYVSTDSTASDQHIVQEDERWHASAWWYGPEGGAPGPDEPDIIIETLPKQSYEAGATDPNLIVLSLNAAFPEMTKSLGTEFMDGVAIPTGTPVASPTLTFPGDGIILAQRPARDCTVTNDLKDPDRFTINVAMLGENQHRYLANLTVEYGIRTWNEACAALVGAQNAEEAVEPESEPKPAQKAEEVKQSSETGAEANGEKVTEVEGEATEKADDASSAAAPDTQGILIGILVIAGIAIVALVALLFRKRPSVYNNDGTKKNGRDSAGPGAFGTQAKRSEF